ncbi:MAG: acetyl-CoA carboxylase biotin carboxylase subunit, partial [Acidimicrobiia bacterium]|nr:acetyl-CoA carboxylase biotin carboxylase subunit [Acidimicrobiia bacterium]
MESVLIANRGEIAVRIIRAVAERGMRTIAVYSELDRDAVHVDLADEAWNIGPAPAAESYLNIDRIIEVAAESGADAVHPGYGFLAENADFAQAVIDADLIWIGPPPHAIATMGDKIASRRAATEAGVEGVPGSIDPVTAVSEVRRIGDEVGYPLAIKAAHGGGGKGLKIVHDPADVDDAYESARRESEAWFASPEVYVEKYLQNTRHIEAQVLFDTQGNGVFLGERDCSAQRRHQKLIEETPAVGLTADQRITLGEKALAIGAAAGYQNAGTVEFLLDESGDFYFLEMNTRLQVEHTITEIVTGIDLVHAQLSVATGQPLPITKTPEPRGHAIEMRINAEDPGRDFAPSPGDIVEYHEPGGYGVRVDSGVRGGSTVSQYYDNLIAKLIVWGADRAEAIDRARRALREFTITGVATTIPAHLVILDHPTFVAGEHHTKFVEDHLDLSGLEHPAAPAIPEDEELTERSITVEVGGRRFVVKLWAPPLPQQSAGTRRAAPRRRPPRLDSGTSRAEGDGVIRAPMQGTIVNYHHEAGNAVKAGEAVCVLEAMKMENEISAPIDGEIVELRVQPGDAVSSGSVL